MRNLCLIAWRPFARDAIFFRGDDRFEIYLPYISDAMVKRGELNGWVRNEEHARVFEVPILFNERSFAKGFDKERFLISPYQGSILPTQIFRPLKRPENPFRWT